MSKFIHREHLASLTAIVTSLATGSPVPAANSVVIDRKSLQMQLINAKGQELLRSPIGIGRGGLKKKRSMADEITPTGTFTVDLILSKDEQSNQISSANAKRYRKTSRTDLVSSKSGLARLFNNMNSLDFDGNGKPDRAYGDAYIGLDGQGTGPKMHSWRGTPYWYSIALHGTPNPASCIGKANSGGCVHLPADTLKKILAKELITIGTKVTIADGIIR